MLISPILLSFHVLTSNYPCYVLLRESKHLRQDVILVKVLEVIDLVQTLLVVVRYILNLAQDLLVLDENAPEGIEVVSLRVECFRSVKDLVSRLVLLQAHY